MISQNKVNRPVGIPITLLAGVTLGFGAFTMKAQDTPRDPAADRSTATAEVEQAETANAEETTSDAGKTAPTPKPDPANPASASRAKQLFHSTPHPHPPAATVIPGLLDELTSPSPRSQAPAATVIPGPLEPPKLPTPPTPPTLSTPPTPPTPAYALWALMSGSDPSQSERGSREEQLQAAYQNLLAAGLIEEAARVHEHLQRALDHQKQASNKELGAVTMQMQQLEKRAQQVESQLQQIHKEMQLLHEKMQEILKHSSTSPNPNPTTGSLFERFFEEPKAPVEDTSAKQIHSPTAAEPASHPEPAPYDVLLIELLKC